MSKGALVVNDKNGLQTAHHSLLLLVIIIILTANQMACWKVLEYLIHHPHQPPPALVPRVKSFSTVHTLPQPNTLYGIDPLLAQNATTSME